VSLESFLKYDYSFPNEVLEDFMKKIFAFILSACLLLPAFSFGSKDVPITSDRAGNAITLPKKVEKVAVFAPSNLKIIDGLGLHSKVVAVDTYSAKSDETLKDLPAFDMMKPDTEKIIALNPDVVFTTGMSKAGGADPYKAVRDAGICVLDIPSSNSIQGIYDDIMFIADVLGVHKKGDEMVNSMKKEIAKFVKIAKTIPAEKQKTVYFEISPAPYMYTTGKNTFINEIIELLGAKNAFSDLDSWASISAEQVLAKNPDVIITSVNYTPQPVEEIKKRSGWNVLKAVKNNAVYAVTADYVSQPCQYVIKGIEEMAKAIYPEYFK